MFGLPLQAPKTDESLYAWVVILMAGYLVVRYGLNLRTRRHTDPGPAVFDAGTFAISVMLLWGVFDPDVLTAIGSTKPFLLVAGFIGILYGLHALFPRNS